MSSPRSMFSGSIELSLLNIPVSIAKATGREESTTSLITEVCYHGDAEGAVRIDRTHRCPQCEGAPLHKTHAIEVENGFRLINSNEWTATEDATKSHSLTIEDVQPLSKLPMMFAYGTYYVRHNDKAKVSPKAYATLVKAIGMKRLGLVCKWGNEHGQKLCVIYAEAGVLVLRYLPFVTDIRPASTKERVHWSVAVNERELERMGELLTACSNPEGFMYSKYENEGLRLRQEVVDRILAGEEVEPMPKPEDPEVDPFELINEAIERAKESKDASKELQTT